MRVVAKYSFVLGATLALVLALLGYVRIHYIRDDLVNDMRHDHRLIGHVLQASIADIWANAAHGRADVQTRELLTRASRELSTTRFEWQPGDDGSEQQRVEDTAFVSRFPVAVAGTPVGTVVARESLDVIDRAVDSHVRFTILGIIAIVLASIAGALLMGGWLVGRPVGLLVEQARKIGRRQLTAEPAFRRRDELGELARELNNASTTLADSLARSDAEAAARLRAVEQVRHSDRLATVGKLAAGIAHELGTPLSVVAGHAQMIAGSEVTGDAALASARAIDAEVTRMGTIVRQLLDFARRKGPEGTTCDPNVVAQRCASLLAVMAERKRVTCEVKASEPVRAMIDEDSLQQVLTNLAVNAIQAMQPGGSIVIAITRVQEAKPCIRIDVTDTGGGIPPDARAHIFEPFFTTKAPGEGTGLGLAVVHGIIEDHGGWITVDTSERGTTFSLFVQEATG